MLARAIGDKAPGAARASAACSLTVRIVMRSRLRLRQGRTRAMHLCVSGQVFLAMWTKREDRPWYWHEPLEWGIAAQMARDCQVATPQRETRRRISSHACYISCSGKARPFFRPARRYRKACPERKAKVGLPRGAVSPKICNRCSRLMVLSIRGGN